MSHSKSKGSPGKGVSRSDVMDLISDSIASFKTEIQGMIREALFPTQEGRSQDHVVSDLPEHAETEDDVVDLHDQDDSVSFCGIWHLNMLGQRKGLLLVNRIIVPLPYPRIALRLINVMRILSLLQTIITLLKRGRGKQCLPPGMILLLIYRKF